MPNHVHLILEPPTEESLCRAVGWAHQRYTWIINRRMQWTGYLWQGRFWSCALDESHLRATVRYVLQNPVRAELVEQAEDWPHSSIAAHMRASGDELVDVDALEADVGDWSAFLDRRCDADEVMEIRRHSRAGLPLGSREFVEGIERSIGRPLRLRSVGRPPRREGR